MKIVFEHLDRKTIIIGNDYESIMNKIRLLFLDKNDSRVLFFDLELNDVFDFTSYDQIQDQANGLKMMFGSTNKLNDSSAAPYSTSSGTSNDTASPASIKRKRKRARREEDDYDVIPSFLFSNMVLIYLVFRGSWTNRLYCRLIVTLFC